MSGTVLKVTGMRCGHSAMSVTQALQQVSGVDKADVSLAPREAMVHGRAGTQGIIDAVLQAATTRR